MDDVCSVVQWGFIMAQFADTTMKFKFVDSLACTCLKSWSSPVIAIQYEFCARYIIIIIIIYYYCVFPLVVTSCRFSDFRSVSCLLYKSARTIWGNYSPLHISFLLSSLSTLNTPTLYSYYQPHWSHHHANHFTHSPLACLLLSPHHLPSLSVPFTNNQSHSPFV